VDPGSGAVDAQGTSVKHLKFIKGKIILRNPKTNKKIVFIRSLRLKTLFVTL
jgi:hypothetical protein